MREKRFDPGLLAAVALALIAAWPFLVRPGLPQFTDAEMHVYRAGEVLASLRAGVLWPRWAPDFYYGYGYPVFNYYSPLSYHLAAYYALLTGTDVVAGTKFVLVASLFLGTLGVWAFVRGRWGSSAGVVAAAAYVLAPYLLYIDPHARGDAPEMLALGVAPVAFWAFDRLYRRGGAGTLTCSALAVAALILSHPLMALLFTGWLVLWLAWLAVVVPAAVPRPVGGAGGPDSADPDRGRRVALLSAALALGVGLAALYWLPVLLERGAIQLGNVAGPGFFDFHRHFLDVSELVAPPALLDLGATEPAFRFSLGWPQIFPAALGALTVFRARLRRIDLLFFVFSVLGLAYLMTDASLQVWESIPQMSFLQFPTRFLGPAALAVAVLSGASLRWVELWQARWAQPTASAALVAGCLVGALPLMYPPPWGPFGPVDPLRMIGVELAGRALGTTSADDFLPVGVLQVPGPQQSYLDGYRSGQLFKVNQVTVPDFATAENMGHGPTFDRIRTTATDRFVLRLFTFYFPGWHAYVDGREVPIDVSAPDGFITFWVPSGEHEVLVQFEDTPPRRLGYLLSGLSLAALGAVVISLRVHRRARHPAALGGPASGLGRQATISLALVFVAFAGLKAASDRLGWFRFTSTGDEVRVAQHQQFVRLGQDFALLGYDLPRQQAGPGQTVPVTLYWKALDQPDHNYQVFVHLMGPDSQLWGQSDKLNPADFPTSRWPTDHYVRDEHMPQLKPDAPPGTYLVVVGLWDAASGQRLPVFDASGNAVGSGVVLPLPIEVR